MESLFLYTFCLWKYIYVINYAVKPLLTLHQFRSLSSQARASPDHLRFTISSESLKNPLMNLHRSSGNHIVGTNITVLLSEVHNAPDPVLNITSKFQDQLSLELTTIAKETAAGKFDIVFGRSYKHSCFWHLT